jgi:hypothetical protein
VTHERLTQAQADPGGSEFLAEKLPKAQAETDPLVDEALSGWHGQRMTGAA